MWKVKLQGINFKMSFNIRLIFLIKEW